MTISDLPLGEHDLTELAAKLKTRLGTGGTIKEGRIKIQGDHRDRIVEELEAWAIEQSGPERERDRGGLPTGPQNPDPLPSMLSSLKMAKHSRINLYQRTFPWKKTKLPKNP